MFLGHFAVGLAAKRAAPKVSLGTLLPLVPQPTHDLCLGPAGRMGLPCEKGRS